MIRLARIEADSAHAPAGLGESVARSELDWLQLDYPRPRIAEAPARGPAELPEYPRGFAGAIREVRQSLFLDPQLRVCASAGWSSAFDCVEGAARALCEGGCGELPLAAVRGSYVLPILEMLVAEGHKLDNIETGQPWRELRAPLLTADLQFGAGPLSTAIDEGARVIVVGNYDGTAPLVAAAATQFGWSWTDYDRIACAAAAAEASLWPDWYATGDDQDQAFDMASRPWWPVVTLEEDGSGLLDLPAPVGAEAGAALRQWLLAGASPAKPRIFADVQLADVEIATQSPAQLRLADGRGAASDGSWRLEVLYQAGFAAEALFEASPAADSRMRRQFIAALHRRSPASGGDAAAVSVEELYGAGGESGPSWIYAACQARSRPACEQFVEALLRLAASHRSAFRLVTGRPVVHVHCGVWPAKLPRGAVDVAVETRPAKEWL